MRTRATSSIRPAARRARSSSPSGARSSRPWTMGHLLHLQLRELQGIVPLRREDAARLVVPGEAADPRFDQLEAASVAQILPVILEMSLKARGAFDQTGEILRQREFRALRGENLGHAPTRRETDVRDTVGVPQPHANGSRREAFLIETDNRLVDLGFIHPHPLRIRLEIRSGRAARAFVVGVEASDRGPWAVLRVRLGPF